MQLKEAPLHATREGRSEGSPFTRFLAGIEPGRPRDRESFDEIWAALRVLLVNELRRRALWTLPPACLGVYGCVSWADEGAVEELLADCFLFVFGERLRSLKAHLRLKANVEGLVLRSVRNFLHDTQKRHDPVGFRVFTLLRSVVRDAVAAGALHVVAGNPGVGRDTVLGCSPAAGPDAPVARPEELRAATGTWNDDLLPQLITARGWDVRPVLEQLGDRIRRLPDQGIRAFRFRDLAEPLGQDARARWRAVWTHSQGEVVPLPGEDGLAALVRLVAPASGLEERESFRCLLGCLERSIDGMAEPDRTRQDLRRILLFLRNHALDADEADGAQRLPSHRKLAELLAIRRERLPRLWAILLAAAHSCRRRCSGAGVSRGGPR